MKNIKFWILTLSLFNCQTVVEYVQPANYAKSEELISCTIQVGIIPAKYRIDTKIKMDSDQPKIILETIPEEPPIEEDLEVTEKTTHKSYNDGVIFESVQRKKMKRRIIKRAYTRTIAIPPREILIEEPILEAPPKQDFRDIVCTNKVTSRFIQKLQWKLKELGEDPGGTDGKLYKKTMEALKKFEIKKGFKETDQSGVFDGRYYIMQSTINYLNIEM